MALEKGKSRQIQDPLWTWQRPLTNQVWNINYAMLFRISGALTCCGLTGLNREPCQGSQSLGMANINPTRLNSPMPMYVLD